MWLVRFCRVHTCRISCAWPERAVILDHAFDDGIVGVVGKGGVDEVSESDNGLFADEWQIAEFVLASGNLICPAAMKHRAGHPSRGIGILHVFGKKKFARRVLGTYA